MSKKIALVILFILLIVSILFPGVSKNEAIKVLNSNERITQQHTDGTVKENDIQVFIPLPLGRLVSTYEGLWFIAFWEAR